MSLNFAASLSKVSIINVPGLNGSGPEHWQSHWDFGLPNCQRVQMGDWALPIRSKWIERLDRDLRRTDNPILIVAHSLGCLAVAWWAKERWSFFHQDRVLGALLVAPPDVERADAPDSISTFSPAPREPLPFRSLLVASRNDPFASFATSQRIAEMWNSELVDLGDAGHINADSGFGPWPEGLRLLASLNPPGRHQSEACLFPAAEADRSRRVSASRTRDPHDESFLARGHQSSSS